MSDKIIVGFIGPSGSGKDTAADYMVEKYGFKKVSFADPLKQMVKECFLLTDEQCYGSKKEDVDNRWGCSPRELFQVLGTEFAQYILPELLPSLQTKFNKRCFWVYHLMEKIKSDITTKLFVIADVRFQHEIDALLKQGAYLFRIDRPNNKETRGHVSEEEWKFADSTKLFPLKNDGTVKDLYEKLNNYFL